MIPEPAPKVTLISPYINITSLGVRYLSSFLRQSGYRTRLVFLPDLEAMADTGVDFRGTYSDQALEALAALVSDSDLLGFTLMTNYYHKVADLSDRLRSRLSIPIAWGGPHPTASPEECLEHADMVCVGEGESAVVELLERLGKDRSLEDIPNLWVRGCRVPPSVYPPLEDLDSLPFPDYSLEDHHVLLGKKIHAMDEELLRLFCTTATNFDEPDEIIYETIASRGCPHCCSFCINYRFQELYRDYRFFRRRSMQNLVEELVSIRQRFPWFNRIVLQDDCFTATSVKDLLDFESMYTRSVGCPFFFLLSSSTMDEERIKPMLRAGFHKAQVGIQSASGRTNALYCREHFSPSALLQRARKLQELSGHSKVVAYDIILDNPFEDVDSMLETLRLAIDLPRPKHLQLWSLTLFPGTRLRELALQEGIIDDPRAHYLKEDHEREFRYINILFTMANRRLPRPVMRLLSWRPLVHMMESRPLRKLFGLFSPMYNRLRRNRGRVAFRERFADMLELAGIESPHGKRT
jgi:anaerobic magnesium-protoporphyrin IX monomethyl ester cyclase